MRYVRCKSPGGAVLAIVVLPEHARLSLKYHLCPLPYTMPVRAQTLLLLQLLLDVLDHDADLGHRLVVLNKMALL